MSTLVLEKVEDRMSRQFYGYDVPRQLVEKIYQVVQFNSKPGESS